MVMLGMGFMSIGDSLEVGVTPERLGSFLICAGLAFVLFAFYMHYNRLRRIETGLKLLKNDSVMYTGALAFLFSVALIIELVMAWKYPYLQRSLSVSIDENLVAAVGV